MSRVIEPKVMVKTRPGPELGMRKDGSRWGPKPNLGQGPELGQSMSGSDGPELRSGQELGRDVGFDQGSDRAGGQGGEGD